MLGRVLKDKTRRSRTVPGRHGCARSPAERQEMAGYLISQLGKSRPGTKEPSRRPLPRRTS